MYIKPISKIDEKTIEQEWDTIADFRDQIIKNGEDISLLDITEPFIMECLGSITASSVLDCGCGTGHLSFLISKKLDKYVTGIDISGKSIERAKKNYQETTKLRFIKSSICSYSKYNNKYDVCIANMVLMDIKDLEENLFAIYNMICENGFFCFTITHPCFWPIYWNYFENDWFNYNSEIYIKAPLWIRNKRIGESTHVHRPLSRYISACINTGFKIIDIQELYPKTTHLELDYQYNYPRFIGFVLKKG